MEAEETEKEIEARSNEYRPVAKRASLLYFCLADLAVVRTQGETGWQRDNGGKEMRGCRPHGSKAQGEEGDDKGGRRKENASSAVVLNRTTPEESKPSSAHAGPAFHVFCGVRVFIECSTGVGRPG